MKNRKNVLFLMLLVSALQFLLITTFVILAGKNFDLQKTTLNFAINLPLSLFMTWLDLVLVELLNKKGWTAYHRYFLEFLLACLILVPILSLELIINKFSHNILNPLSIRIIAPAILSNCMLFLLIEVYTSQKRLAEMAEQRTKFQFEALKNQINPHFLFNSLNVLASLTYQSPETANAFTKKLAQIYRYLLDTQKQYSVLAFKEMNFADNYIYMERIRYQSFLKIEISGHERLKNQRLIPTSIQMLVENAIKHNIATAKNPLTIFISILDSGVEVRNNIQLRNYIDSHEIGLKNLQNQLKFYNKEIIIKNDSKNFIVFVPWI